MHSFLEVSLTLLTLAGYALGRPINIAGESQRFWRLDVGTTQCFTARAAIATDCQALLANPPIPDWTNLAAADVPPVFNPFCSGSCCVFTDTSAVPTEDLVSAANTLMGCLEPANGLINGVTKTEKGSVCMADSTGASSCFDHSQ
ncbi:hypothetical protein MVEN_00916400 [Mycena venus]|uniref:Uncharacterized protein n=1 Tax=Mycena venus TaxID=2733690 RepID=A0A8H6Y7T9_9AGAR|nr:hypothetical protein MVEN_00916400 [Mycena venus]